MNSAPMLALSPIAPAWAGFTFTDTDLVFPGGSVAKNLPANAGDIGDAGDRGDPGEMGSIPGSGRSPGIGNLLQYSCLENSIDRGAWWAIVHGVTKSQT